MDASSVIILIVVSLIALAIAFLLYLHLRREERKLRAASEAAREIASLPEQKPTDYSLDSLSRTLEMLKGRLEKLTAEAGMEREKFRAVISGVSEGILVTDDGGRVALFNREAGRLFNIPEEGEGKTFISLVRDHELNAILERCLNSKQRQNGVIQAGMLKRYLEINALPLSTGAVLIVHDLSRIRRLEKIRQDFVSNISHELRTPIASLKALVETLQDGAMNEPQVANEFLQRMQVETDKLTQMVSELGELSRIENAGLVLRREPLDIPMVAGKVVERMKAQAERQGLTLEVDIPGGLPMPPADEDRIEQVLVNLVHNAIKFNRPGGKVRLEATARAGEVRLSVADSGIGISEEDLPRVFERFYKADKARTGGGGTGLGLAIAKHIVQAHGGSIGVDSTEGKGATFTFTLPAAAYTGGDISLTG